LHWSILGRAPAPLGCTSRRGPTRTGRSPVRRPGAWCTTRRVCSCRSRSLPPRSRCSWHRCRGTGEALSSRALAAVCVAQEEQSVPLALAAQKSTQLGAGSAHAVARGARRSSYGAALAQRSARVGSDALLVHVHADAGVAEAAGASIGRG